MKKATLTGRQMVAAIFAGVFGHVLFAIGWIGLGLLILGGILFALLGGSIEALLGSFLDPSTISETFTTADGRASSRAVGRKSAADVIIVDLFFLRMIILRGCRVRRPWATTLSSLAIVAVLDVPLVFVYAAVSTGEDRPGFLLVAVLGTVIVGILVWLWMTWGHRGPASDFAGKTVTGTGTATAVEAPTEPASVEAVPAPSAVEAPATPAATRPKKAPAKPE